MYSAFNMETVKRTKSDLLNEENAVQLISVYYYKSMYGFCYLKSDEPTK